MINYFEQPIIPYVGTKSFPLYASYNEIKTALDTSNVQYTEEVWQVEGETIPNPWKVIIVPNTISLFFAKNDKLFKLVLWNNFIGQLPNGIHTGLSMDKAKLLDDSLQFNDWDELYESNQGYWLEDNLDDNTILSISIFIEEIDDVDFNKCEW